MRNSIASYKESLYRIAHEVLEAAEEEVRENGSASISPNSQQSSQYIAPRPHANGTDHGCIDEIAKYKADIQKLQTSESEIKALSFSYAALLKEKEEQIQHLCQENVLLRKNLASRKDDGSILGDESKKALSILGDESKKALSNDYVTPKEHEKLLKEVQSLKALQSGHVAELKLLKEKLDDERANTSILNNKLQVEQQLNKSSHQELYDLKRDMEKVSDSKELQNKLDRTLSELRMLQAELGRRDFEKEQNESLESLKSTMQRLEMEKLELTAEKNELEAKLNSFVINKLEKNDAGGSDFQYASKNEPNEVKMASKISELEEILKETCQERDKASQELLRLKQHLLDKELEDEDKMDEDCKLIEELKALTEYQRAQILQLENALLQEQIKREELNKLKHDEFHQSNETMKGLKQKLANFMSIIDSKNIELQNLQTALGQYYAETEAKERFGRELTVAREESAKYLELLNATNRSLEASKKEKEEINARLAHTERLLSETRLSMHKLEEDSTRLRHALERSMITLNRMSLDSDNYVDRRIVIKLLVTYFQRNHSKEVLDLMVRMLGFSEEDKQRIGFAQNIVGKGVVRGVLGLPGRLVGGILGGSSGGSSPAASSPASSDHQSFADLWVDFLLKETEERGKREFSEDAGTYSGEQSSSPSPAIAAVPAQGTRGLGVRPSSEQVSYSSSVKQLDAEFSTVPLTPANSVSPSPAPLNQYRYRDIN